MLVYHLLVDDDGIVHVATLDEIGFKQWFDIAHKHEGTCRGDLLFKIIKRVERSKLAIDKLRVERTHRRNAKLVVGKDGNARTCFLVLYLNLVANDIIIFRYTLLFNTYTLYLLHIHDGRAIENGKLRTVNLYKAVIDTHSIEGRKTVFYSRNTHVAIGKHSTSLRVDHSFGQRIDDRLAFQINSLYLIASVFGCGIEGNRKAQSCMQAFATQGKAAFQCCLF